MKLREFDTGAELHIRGDADIFAHIPGPLRRDLPGDFVAASNTFTIRSPVKPSLIIGSILPERRRVKWRNFQASALRYYQLCGAHMSPDR